MNKRFATVGLVGACAVCCAPLWVSAVAGTGLTAAGTAMGTLLSGAPADTIFCVALILGALVGFAVWTYRRRGARVLEACDCEVACRATGCAATPNRATSAMAQHQVIDSVKRSSIQ